MKEFGKLMVLMLGLVWAPLGLCWAAPRVGLGIHWATWGCHGPFFNTLMTPKGEQAAKLGNMRKAIQILWFSSSKERGAGGLDAHLGDRLGPSWVLSGCSGGRFGHSLSNLGLSSPVFGHIDVT